MKETFETNLVSSQKEEMTNQKAYEDLKAAKEEEISAGQTMLDTKSVELGTVDEKAAMSKEDLDDTQNTLAADQTFLAALKEHCATLDAEYEERTKTRQAEIGATSKALAFLSSDEAHDLFSRSVGFTQVTIRRKSARRESVYAQLKEAAKRFSDPRLSTLAQRAKLDAFAKVKKSIQDMVDNLIKEKEDEIKHKDFCVEELNNNERDIEMKERDKADKKAKIDDLEVTIDELGKAMEQLKLEIAEMQVQMKRAGEDREKENKNFQMEIADQRATQKLLNAALGVLKGFYDKAALVQKKSNQPLEGMPQFKPMEKNAAGGGVMGMIAQVINESKALEARLSVVKSRPRKHMKPS
jgi:chromosome segregation ATPase